MEISACNGSYVNLTAGIFTFTANPPAGYSFTNWNTNGSLSLTSTTSNPTTASVTGPATLTATFTPSVPLPPSLATLAGLLLIVPAVLVRRRSPRM